jgi:hypothetical protein
MANQDKVSRAPARANKPGSGPEARLGSRSVDLGAGVRMHCREVDADLAIIRFLCAPPAHRGEPSPTAGAKRARRSIGSS